MNEKKQIKISLKIAIILFFIFVIIVGTLIFFIINKINNKFVPIQYSELETVSVKIYQNEFYYIIEDDYLGEYDLQYTMLSEYFHSDFDIRDEFEKQTLMNYTDYKAYCNKWNFEQKYTDSSQNYIVFSYLAYGSPNIDARLATVEYTDNNVTLYIWDDAYVSTADISAYVIIVPTTKPVNNINIQPVYTNEEYDNIKKYGTSYNPTYMTVYKPIIYLYPKEETEILVELGYPKNITCSYPRYANSGWKVQAKPNGDLFDLLTKRNLYSLYYESKGIIDFKVENTGFIVKGEDTIQFLEEKLAILGLTERETEEYIIYWLPILEANNYNYIRFATMEEINSNMPLNIKPNPDTIIRVLMTYKGLEEPIEVEEQELVTPKRQGFVAVEWGGTEIK